MFFNLVFYLIAGRGVEWGRRLFFVLFVISSQSWAFERHSLMTHFILTNDESVGLRLSQNVKAQTFQSFFSAVVNNREHTSYLKQALHNIQSYSKTLGCCLPDVSTEIFPNPQVGFSYNSLSASFLENIGIHGFNNNLYIKNFFESYGDYQSSDPEVKKILPDMKEDEEVNVRLLEDGEYVLAKDVLVASTDEPGLLFNKHITQDSARLSLTTFHENWLVRKLLPQFSNNHYCEYQIKKFFELSKFAFKSGHDYWGYRFLGWGLHYLHDLSNPYNCAIAPQHNSFKLFMFLIADKIGFSKYIQATLLQNAYMRRALDTYTYVILKLCANKRKELQMSRKNSATRMSESPLAVNNDFDDDFEDISEKKQDSESKLGSYRDVEGQKESSEPSLSDSQQKGGVRTREYSALKVNVEDYFVEGQLVDNKIKPPVAEEAAARSGVKADKITAEKGENTQQLSIATINDGGLSFNAPHLLRPTFVLKGGNLPGVLENIMPSLENNGGDDNQIRPDIKNLGGMLYGDDFPRQALRVVSKEAYKASVAAHTALGGVLPESFKDSISAESVALADKCMVPQSLDLEKFEKMIPVMKVLFSNISKFSALFIREALRYQQ